MKGRCITDSWSLFLWCWPFSLSFFSITNVLSLQPSPTSSADLPCVGSWKSGNTQVTVIGTSHFKCNSAQEVVSVIEELRPDGVVVELDPERVIRLTLEGTKPHMEKQSMLFGADFLAAIETAQRLDIPLFIGDEYAQETKSRLLNVFDIQAYKLNKLMPFGGRSSSSLHINEVDVLGTVLADPRKLTPLVVTIAPAFLTLLWTLQSFPVQDILSDLSLVFSILFSVLITCKTYTTLIVDRDEILAMNAIQAVRTLQSLQDKTTIRKRWTFTVDTTSASAVDDEPSGIPLFTLKTPLQPDVIRNLNLFEPRWLKMVDRLNKQIQAKGDCRLGCISCTNKFYSAIHTEDGREGRYADVIFKREGRMANVIEMVEGKRPVSGARKVTVQIEGKDSFVVNETNISVVKEGYLVTLFTSAISMALGGDSPLAAFQAQDDKSTKDIHIILVVGLLHANGVLDCLSSNYNKATSNAS